MARVKQSGARKNKDSGKKWDDHGRILLCAYSRRNPKVSQRKLKAWLQETHGYVIAQSTISDTLKQSDKYLEPSFVAGRSDGARARKTKHPQVDEGTFSWFLTHQEQVVMTGELIKTQAALLYKSIVPQAEQLPKKLTAEGWSNGWLESWKQRYHVKSFRRHGESGSVNPAVVEHELVGLQQFLASYSRCDIFNMDETALFYMLEPDTGLATERFAGKKTDKKRLTIVACVNCDGSEFMDLWVIGKFQNPRPLNGINRSLLGCQYRATNRAWMTGPLFQEWLRDFDSKMRNRNVVLLLDNASTHKAGLGLELQNVTLKFLPPNTTSVIQPLDQGIIRSLKVHYRRLFYTEVLNRMNQVNREQAMRKWDILDALRTIVAAWRDGVTASTVLQCWSHSWVKVLCGPMPPTAEERLMSSAAGPVHAPVRQETVEPELPSFLHAPVRAETVEPELPPYQNHTDESDLNDIITRMGYRNRMSVSFLLNEDTAPTEASPSLEDIIQSVSEVPEAESQNEVEVLEHSRPLVKPHQALEAVETLRDWCYQQETLDEDRLNVILRGLTLGRRLALQVREEKATQTNITQFFARAGPSSAPMAVISDSDSDSHSDIVSIDVLDDDVSD